MIQSIIVPTVDLIPCIQSVQYFTHYILRPYAYTNIYSYVNMMPFVLYNLVNMMQHICCKSKKVV